MLVIIIIICPPPAALQSTSVWGNLGKIWEFPQVVDPSRLAHTEAVEVPLTGVLTSVPVLGFCSFQVLFFFFWFS